MAPRLIVLGWDSATFEVVDPLLAEGRLPALHALIDKGFRAPLRSTWPPMTDSAWTSAFTGCNPGRHGIFGSWYRAPGEYACRYFSSRDRRAPASWEMTEDVRHLVWNVPMTFPPSEVPGVMVAGYGSPPGARITEPASFQEEIASRWPLADLLDRAPHGSLETFRADLIRGLEVQSEALVWAARESGADCVSAVWPHVDRAQHFFWQFRGTDDPLSGAVDEVYVAMDRATQKILDAFPESDLLVVSDHGAGRLNGDVNVGAWLARRGRAAYGGGRRAKVADAVWALPPGVRKLGRRLAPGLARRAMGAKLTGQLGSFDWAATDAFLGFHSDLWLNLEGRESRGRVPPEAADALLAELTEGLLGIVDPATGARVFAAAHRRDDIYSGDAAHMAPDLMLDPWSAGYRVAPAREAGTEVVVAPEPLAGVEVAWSSDHRPLGIFVAAGPHVRPGAAAELDLYDVCPTSLALLGEPVPYGLDGRAAAEIMTPEFLAGHPIATRTATGPRDAGGEYSADEAAAVAAHLKDLGYIE
ncbi:MAG: alkaline phosphatase family protein [Actinomycetota bacterium]